MNRIVCEVVHESVGFESVCDTRLHDFANGLLSEAALGMKVALDLISVVCFEGHQVRDTPFLCVGQTTLD